MMPQSYDAIVVGSGHNGLVAANYLSRAGLSVLVLERRDLVGGACVTEELFPGFNVSSCSYVSHLLQEKVVDDLSLKRHGLNIFPLDPYRFFPHPSGQYTITWHDDEQTRAEIERVSPADARRFPDWCHFWKQAAGILHRYFLSDPPTFEEVEDAVAGSGDEEVFRRMVSGNMTDLVREHFESEVVQGSYIDAQDAGNSRAPGSIMASTYIRCNQFTRQDLLGIPKGGMGNITQSLARAARSAGVDIRTGAEIERILVRRNGDRRSGDGRAYGVRLDSGEEIEAEVVLSNADPKRTYLRLLAEEDLGADFAASVRELKTDASYLKFHCTMRELPDFSRYLGPDYDPKLLAQVRLCPSIDYFHQSWDDASAGRISSCPIMTIQIPTVLDDSIAPAGQHILSAWCLYAPVKLANGSWEESRQQAGEQLIDLLTEYAPNARDAIIDWSLFTPADLEERVYLTDGNIRHLDIIPSQMLSRRPGYRSPIQGLYLCGAGTHPGGEVTAAPGHNAARAVLRDLGRKLQF